MEPLLSAIWSEPRREAGKWPANREWRQPQGSGQRPREPLEHRTPQGIPRGEESRRSLRRGQRARVCGVPRGMEQSVVCCGEAGKTKTAMSPGCFLLKKCLHKESTITVENIKQKEAKGRKKLTTSKHRTNIWHVQKSTSFSLYV